MVPTSCRMFSLFVFFKCSICRFSFWTAFDNCWHLEDKILKPWGDTRSQSCCCKAKTLDTWEMLLSLSPLKACEGWDIRVSVAGGLTTIDVWLHIPAAGGVKDWPKGILLTRDVENYAKKNPPQFINRQWNVRFTHHIISIQILLSWICTHSLAFKGKLEVCGRLSDLKNEGVLASLSALWPTPLFAFPPLTDVWGPGFYDNKIEEGVTWTVCMCDCVCVCLVGWGTEDPLLSLVESLHSFSHLVSRGIRAYSLIWRWLEGK